MSQKVIDLFHKVVSSSEGYRAFVSQHHCDPNDISGFDDIHKIPVMDKHNYIKKFPIEQRLYGGKQLSDYYMVCFSSGSSGEPTFWPRDYTTDKHIEKLQEQLYEEHFHISKYKTLCIVTFGLGVWTAGMLTSKLSWATAENNKFTVVTPGMDKDNIHAIIEKLSPYYEQSILVGYPPFITDVIESGLQKGIKFKGNNVKIFCTSERFSELWRNAMAEHVSPTDSRYDVVGFYACSDTGIVGSETRFSIDLLAAAAGNQDLCYELFGSTDTPSFAAYNPQVKYIEAIDGEIVISADQPVPLIRYNIHDRGGVLTKNEIIHLCKKYSVPYVEELVSDHFVYIFGRSDAVKVTANIYIEDIKYCIEHSRFKHKLTGNFKYGTEPTKDLRYRLKVVLYLRQGEVLSLEEKKVLASEFYDNLLKANNDFKMIQEGTKIQKFKFIFEHDREDKYKSSKLKYFL